ncbi:MAG: hypothetical protein A3K19_18145 [Lentisphaerae bacterium RIFOXYB12_FULL_65_16]|nr:MAG: hypothetical protein A3K18_12535 [Lentisphaerae bacterium RIFOXYA12_64_32]OGV87098.1 MAG: hypothetical protein A3K19_18145 [Lentisphaerae bacterium RIFOXYB12_FULL_65_16]
MNSIEVCRICTSSSLRFGEATLIDRHRTAYYQCPTCGFVQTSDPTWLADAYANAVTDTDIGLISRNLLHAAIARALITVVFDARATFLDYGAGYGMFVRLMRDAGYDFRYHDKHCRNLFATGLEVTAPSSTAFTMLTAFEVLEHLADPIAGVDEMLRYSDAILFTTELVSSPAPSPDAWWYYGLEHGQHISFFTVPALEILADRFGLRLSTNRKNIHLLTRRSIPSWLFRVLSRQRIASTIAMFARRQSLLPEDYRRISGKDLR